ncbi:hypothetical protein [Erythrobacter aurantius]|uniref:hypothetical protein n=1 Tax=Erythrobacter aurantius TaxID=2909249 RepID=UPI00207940CE|nr:hypothetical protein [Erythrobacter aurantius]
MLIGLGFATALLWNWVGRESVGLMAVFGVSMIAGLLLLSVNAIVRLSRGDLQLRPIAALKRAPLIFVIMIVVYALAGVIFPATQIDWTETLVKCAIISSLMAIYFSAYRKPA